jgi:hypothetical protein
MPNQSVTRLLQRRGNTEALWCPHRGAKWSIAAVVMRHEGGPSRLLTESASDKTKESNGPRTAHSDEPITEIGTLVIARRAWSQAEEGACLSDRSLRELFSLKIDPLQQRRYLCTLRGVIGGKQCERRGSIADPTSGIDSWRDREARNICTIWRLCPRRTQKRRDSDWHVASTVHHLECGAHNHAKFISNGDHVCDPPDHRQHGELC